MNNDRKYGLLVRDIEKIQKIFFSNPGIESVILFGSRAMGNFHPGSDVDLALEGTGLNLNDVLTAKIEIDKLDLPYKFDLIIFNSINEKLLRDHIERVGIIFYKKNH